MSVEFQLQQFSGWLAAPASPARKASLGLERAANACIAAVLLVLAAPLMAVVALLIWRSGGLPIFFGHYRVGLSGRLFRCWKFRSMVVDADAALADHLAQNAAARLEWAREHKLTDDPRITSIGRWLRRTSLDELPQLWNVLMGDMNLVGPRPITVAELKLYGPVRWDYLRVRPGLTGLWQVSGRNEISYAERVRLDQHYISSRSVWGDAQILVKTVKVVLARDGAR
jgi:exopolysaccharide production protein ExoY